MEIVRDSLVSSVDEENSLEEQAIRVLNNIQLGKWFYFEWNI